MKPDTMSRYRRRAICSPFAVRGAQGAGFGVRGLEFRGQTSDFCLLFSVFRLLPFQLSEWAGTG
jgi:hypothetical protein